MLDNKKKMGSATTSITTTTTDYNDDHTNNNRATPWKRATYTHRYTDHDVIREATGTVPVGNRDQSDEKGQNPPGCYVVTVPGVFFQRYLWGVESDQEVKVELLDKFMLKADNT